MEAGLTGRQGLAPRLISIGGGADWVGLVSIRCGRGRGRERRGRVGLVVGLMLALAFSTAGTSTGTELRGGA